MDQSCEKNVSRTRSSRIAIVRSLRGFPTIYKSPCWQGAAFRINTQRETRNFSHSACWAVQELTLSAVFTCIERGLSAADHANVLAESYDCSSADKNLVHGMKGRFLPHWA